MSFNRVHTAEETVDGVRLWFGVYADGSANLILDEKNYITIDPHENECDADVPLGVREWLGRELKIGRDGAMT